MAAFATFADAEARARAKVADGTWINAFACYAGQGSSPAVRFQRKMSPSAPSEGAWVETTDDATV